jgi:translation initiation factor IF-2
LAQEKIRIYQLAAQLNVQTKDLLELCQRHGIDVRNQLSTLDPDLRDKVIELVKRGGSAPTSSQPKPPPPAKLPTEPRKITNLEPRRAPVGGVKPAEVTSPAPETPAAPEMPAAGPPQEPQAPLATIPVQAESASQPPPEPGPVVEPAVAAPKETPPAPAPQQPAASRPTPPPEPPKPIRPVVPPTSGRPVRDLGSGGGGAPRPQGARPPAQSKPPATRPSSHRMAPPPPQKPRQAGPEEKKPAPQPTGPRKIAEIPPELRDSNKPIRIEDLLRPINRAPAAGGVPGATAEIETEEDEAGKGGPKKRGAGGVAGRDQRHKQRQARASDRLARGEGGKGLLLDDGDRPQVKQLIHKKRRLQQGTQPRKGKIPIELPITVRSLSAAMSLQSGKLLMKLMEHGAPASININSVLDPDLAGALALEEGCELEIKRPPDAEEQLLKEFEKPDAPEELMPRAPIVTIMGHVDHGKTSLLDRIRKSNVVDTEAGGITQVLRAWRVDHGGKPITFLDTPGHEAFTKMRARGANVTDIAVIVVAATDGVMPQTEEAISHAKASEVAIIVAINKIDMPNANLTKTRNQLYSLGLVPDDMGGDVPFVHTSAVTGEGIDALLDTISLVAELEELKANPNKPAQGTCLEATVSEGEGVLATLLVQDGTLHRGDVVLCGAAHGRVRAMYDDLGRPIEEAGPSVPCRITGLDVIPNADDPFVVVEDLAVAREVAEKRTAKQQEAGIRSRSPMDLGSLLETKATELKIIFKADVRGSVEAIKKELEKLHHEEVRLNILHTGIGAINESDVSLALVSPKDTLVVGFNVVPDDEARALADERGVKILEYDIIYKLTDDMRSALEGKLKPKEEIVHLGRAVVRQTFKISRVGTVAGCRVTQGVIERSAKVRVIRNGVVIYPPPDRTAGLESLKRVKDDVREVQQGYECGLKIAGYDDIKVDDVIEAYRIDQVQRTLS